ncbi:MAG: DUF308 domain-containing protein [Coprobacillus sp.]
MSLSDNKFYFFLTFLLGIVFLFLGCVAFIYTSYFMYFIVFGLGLMILINAIHCIVQFITGTKRDFIQLIIHTAFGLLFVFFPQLPFSVVVIIFAIYICVTGLSHFITYCFYRREQVNGRLAFLISAIVLLIVGVSFLLSPIVHARQMTYIVAIYMIYIGIRYMGKSIRELLSEDRKDSLKRHIRVSLPVFLEALAPRLVLEYINEKLSVEENVIIDDQDSPLEVLVHVSKEGTGAIGHVDICYGDHVIAYGAYDEESHHLFGAIGDGVLFETSKEKYIPFCLEDDTSRGIFGFTLYLDDIQKELVQKTIQEFKEGLILWQPPCYQDIKADDYASRLYKATKATFYKFKKGQFKRYFVMTTNCVLLVDRIIGKSGIDIVNMNGIITPGTYYSFLEEESKKENSRVLKKNIYYKTSHK